MDMIVRVLLWSVVLGMAAGAPQTATGEIAGRVTDNHRSSLPGVRVTITNDDQSVEAITGADGRFVLSSLTMGRYRVAAELAGFRPASGEITLSRSNPRAFLAWSLEVGCLVEEARVILGPRNAARLVDAIIHIRVVSVDGPTLMSVRPDCPGQLLQQYSVQVLASVPGPGRTGAVQRRVLMPARDARLRNGQEYLALLWPDGFTTADLVLPVVSGRWVRHSPPS